MDEPVAPAWVRVASRVIPHLPAGRYRAAALVSRGPTAPFVARMPPELGGARFWCDLHDAIARDVCLVGSYEPQVTQVFARLVSPGTTIVDAGANWGYFTQIAASLTGAGGRVLAFEPDPRLHELLERNLQLNGFPHVTALPIALGRASGTLTLHGYADDAANRGTSRVSDGIRSEGGTSFSVRSERLDDVLFGRGIDRVDLIKIDVEGAEDAVLEGMRDGLHAGRYRRVLLELHPDLLGRRGVTADACCAMLVEAGYEGWAFDHSPAAVRRAAYARTIETSQLLRRTDRVPPTDPWPHMLWTLPAWPPL